jgi:hypothetical protein
MGESGEDRKTGAAVGEGREDRFSHASDEDLVYYDEKGNRISAAEWRELVRVSADRLRREQESAGERPDVL